MVGGRGGCEGLWFDDLNGLYGALYFTRTAEYTILFTGGIGLPYGQECLSTVVGCLTVHSLLFRGYVEPIEHVGRADGYADAVGDAYVKVHTNGFSVNVQLLADSFLPQNLVPEMLLNLCPLGRERGVVNEFSNVSSYCSFYHS